MKSVKSHFAEMLGRAELKQKGLIIMDDTSHIIQTNAGQQKRYTWVAVLIPPGGVEYAAEQMHGVVDFISSQFGAPELHANEVFQRKGAWSGAPINQLKAIVAAIAHILEKMEYPVIVQTFWKGNEAFEEVSRSTPRSAAKEQKRMFGIDFRSPSDFAFAFCLHRCRVYIEATYPDTDWEIFADQGIRKPGQVARAPIRWANAKTAKVHFEDSKTCQLIQLADFAAYFLSRSQQIANKAERSKHDEELMDILGSSLNYVNIPYKFMKRLHEI